MVSKPTKAVPEARRMRSAGKNPLVGFRLPPEMMEAVDNWAARNKTASRSEALRALIEHGLKSKRGDA
jgi:Arc/MetJ-type ribon-helix-helix transcriptional regulator